MLSINCTLLTVGAVSDRGVVLTDLGMEEMTCWRVISEGRSLPIWR